MSSNDGDKAVATDYRDPLYGRGVLLVLSAGVLWSLTGLFIRQGPVVQVRDSNGQIYIKPDLDPKVAYDGPLVVLTSRFSASASEIVAASGSSGAAALSAESGSDSNSRTTSLPSTQPRRLCRRRSNFNFSIDR